MRHQIYDKDSGTMLLNSVTVADSFWTRFLGLMGTPGLERGSGLLLKNVRSIHTCFMRYPIHVLYLDSGYRIIADETLAPWRCGRWHPKARHVLEIGVNDTMKFYQGMRLTLQ